MMAAATPEQLAKLHEYRKDIHIYRTFGMIHLDDDAAFDLFTKAHEIGQEALALYASILRGAGVSAWEFDQFVIDCKTGEIRRKVEGA